jgi:hypothetical protein
MNNTHHTERRYRLRAMRITRVCLSIRWPPRATLHASIHRRLEPTILIRVYFIYHCRAGPARQNSWPNFNTASRGLACWPPPEPDASSYRRRAAAPRLHADFNMPRRRHGSRASSSQLMAIAMPGEHSALACDYGFSRIDAFSREHCRRPYVSRQSVKMRVLTEAARGADDLST